MAKDIVERLINGLEDDPNPPPMYAWNQNILRYKKHIFITSYLSLKQYILQEGLSSSTTWNLGFQKNYEVIKCSFF